MSRLTAERTRRRQKVPASSSEAIEDALSRITRWARLHALHRVSNESGVDIDVSGLLIVTTLHRLGPMRMSDLATTLGLDRSTISRQVASVVQQGYVQKTDDANDARASQLALTPRGHAARQKLNQAWRNVVGGLIADLSPAEQAQLGDLLGRVARGIDAEPAH